MEELDKKLNEVFPGRVVRKDLLHRIKKGTNIPSFVLEFLLAKYCASDDHDEIENGIQAVLETLQQNYVRADESNKAQSTVQQKGSHKFIDKVHVSFNEREKKHWAEMENFGSRRIAIPEKFYRDNDRLLEGGIWAEATVAHNDIEDDDYAFFIEALKPIQLSRFDPEEFYRGREKFTRDEWLNALIRTIGLEPGKMDFRLKMHFLARLFCLVEANYNFIELGPRGTGKSFTFSEFSPYSTLVSQVSTATLFYNNNRRHPGLVSYWDTVAFDEVGRVRIKDRETVDILKSYMASGRFSRGVEVVANASLAFVGNIDFAIDQIVNSAQFDLFIPLPKDFDLAVLDRFFNFLPGWEMPKNSSEFLTGNYGFITDYLAEAFHLLSKQSRYDFVNNHCRFGKAIEGRDEMAVKRTVAALLKLLHPVGEPTPEELDQYMEYAVEGRRRVKEQLNKRKHDEEYANINLSYFNHKGAEITVFCPESRTSPATQRPVRQRLAGTPDFSAPTGKSPKEDSTSPTGRTCPKSRDGEVLEGITPVPLPATNSLPASAEGIKAPEEDHFTIRYGSTGFTYETIFGPYLAGAKVVKIEDPYIRSHHQIQNLSRFAELLVRSGTLRHLHLLTGFDDQAQQAEATEKFCQLRESLAPYGIDFTWEFDEAIHDREIRFDNGWVVKIGRGLDFYQKPENWYCVGSSDLNLRPCLETKVDVFREQR